MAQDPSGPMNNLDASDTESNTSSIDMKAPQGVQNARTSNASMSSMSSTSSSTSSSSSSCNFPNISNISNFSQRNEMKESSSGVSLWSSFDTSPVLTKFSKEPGGRGANEDYRVPRNFKLLEELEYSEKGLVNDTDLFNKYGNDINWINYGLDCMDPDLTSWNASIIPTQDTAIGDRIYQLKMITGSSYPSDPPFITFIQRVDLPFVDDYGTVNIGSIDKKFVWNREKTMLEILIAIRRAMRKENNAEACNEIEPDATYGY